MGALSATGTSTGILPARPVPVKSSSSTPPQPPLITLLGWAKEDDSSLLSGRRIGPGGSEKSLMGQSPDPVTMLGNGSTLMLPVMDLNKRLGFTGSEERPSSGGGLSQQFAGTLGATGRVYGQVGGMLGETGIGASDPGLLASRLFTSAGMTAVPGGPRFHPPQRLGRTMCALELCQTRSRSSYRDTDKHSKVTRLPHCLLVLKYLSLLVPL